jgi:hypothetical protein
MLYNGKLQTNYAQSVKSSDYTVYKSGQQQYIKSITSTNGPETLILQGEVPINSPPGERLRIWTLTGTTSSGSITIQHLRCDRPTNIDAGLLSVNDVTLRQALRDRLTGMMVGDNRLVNDIEFFERRRDYLYRYYQQQAAAQAEADDIAAINAHDHPANQSAPEQHE